MLKQSWLSIMFLGLAITQIPSAELHASTSLLSRPLPVQPSAPTQECGSYAKTMRVAARHKEGGGIGYSQGYTTLETFFAPAPSGNWMPFLDLRGHLFNDGKLAANAGIGMRMMSGCRVYGMNGYYTYRKTKRQHYNQASLGFETLGDVFDFRINGYLPFGDKKSKAYRLQFDHFSGHHIILSERFEYAMKGADAELGFHFGKTAHLDFWAAAGPYYFIGELGGPRWGAKGRIGASFWQYLTVEFLNSWDSMFHYRPQGQVTLSWPFGPKAKTKKSCPCSLSTRMVQPVNNQEIIVVGHRNKDQVAIDPTTGLPFFVLFVDNTSSSSGTFESPYPSLAQAQNASAPGDIIYVFPGNGTTANMDMGMTLQLNQRFWGSGVSHPLPTQLGSIVIPAQSVTNPLITSSSSTAIILASGNEVSGFSITRAFLNGIAGTNVTNVTLSNLWIFGTQASGEGGGHGINIFEDNGITNHLALSHLFITNNEGNGIFIVTDGTSSVDLLIDHSTTSLNGGIAGSGIVLDALTTSNMNVSLQNSSILSNQSGGLILDSSSTGFLNYHLENNTIQGNINVGGISALFTGNSTVNCALLGNTIRGNTQGTQFLFTGPSALIAQNNHSDANIDLGWRLTAGNSAFTATFENNTINQNSNGGGVRFDPNGTQNIDLVFQNNNVSGNSNSAFVLHSLAGMQMSVALLQNRMIGNCGAGLFIPDNIASLSLVVKDNIINDNCEDAINVAQATIVTTALNIVLDNNTINGNDGAAFSSTPSSVPSYTLVANNNIMEGNASFPIIATTQEADTFITVSNNIISDNGEILQIQSLPTGANHLEILFDNNQISTLGVEFSYNGTNTGTNSFTAINNTVQYSNGFQISVDNGSSGGSMDMDISNNQLIFNTIDGMNLFASPTNPFTINTTLSSNTFYNNQRNGLRITAQDSAIFNIHAEHNTLFNNDPLGNADMLVTNNAASICLEMLNNTSNVGYTLTNAGGTFNLAPLNAQDVNGGTISTSGGVMSVPSCP